MSEAERVRQLLMDHGGRITTTFVSCIDCRKTTEFKEKKTWLESDKSDAESVKVFEARGWAAYGKDRKSQWRCPPCKKKHESG